MEHLIYVLWTDHWKPWLTSRLKDAGYILVGTTVVFVVCFTAILCEIGIERMIGD